MPKSSLRALESASAAPLVRPRVGGSGASNITGTYTRYPALVDTLPPLIKIQRRLAARIAAVDEAVKDEKKLRADIDWLLLQAGLVKGDAVTCAGYDVRHNERAGSTSLNQEKLTEQLVAAGVDRGLVDHVLKASTETGSVSLFCTVTPSKGATVKAPQPLRMAKAKPRRA